MEGFGLWLSGWALSSLTLLLQQKSIAIHTLLPSIFAFARELHTRLANDVVGAVVAGINRSSNVQPLGQTSEQTADKGISSAVQVDNLFRGAQNGLLLQDLAVHKGDGGLGALSEDDSAASLGVHLFESGQFSASAFQVVFLMVSGWLKRATYIPAVLLGKGGSFVLVTLRGERDGER